MMTKKSCTFAPMNFELALAEEKVKPHQTTALHLIAGFALLALGAITTVVTLALNFTQSLPVYAPVLGPVVMVLGLLLVIIVVVKNKWILQPKRNRVFRLAELVIIATLSILCYINHWNVISGIFGVLAATLIFSLYWEQEAGNKLTVQIDEGGIKLPVTSRKRSLTWPEVERVILKFGVLTIDCADNHLYQWNVLAFNFDVDQMEGFCAAQVAANLQKRVQDW